MIDIAEGRRLLEALRVAAFKGSISFSRVWAKVNMAYWLLNNATDLLYTIDRAEAAERELAEAQADSERFEWWFSSDVDKWNFMTTYFQGIRERWPLSQWRAAIDAERGKR